MDFNTLLKYIYNDENIISKITTYDETQSIELQWPRSNLILINNQIFLPYKELSSQNIDHLLQWIIGKILTFYYNRNHINDDMKIVQHIVHVFINTLKICLLKYKNNHEVLCEKNTNLTKLLYLFHYSRLFVDDEKIENIIMKHRDRSYIYLLDVVFDNMNKCKNNNFVYFINMNHDFHVEFFKNTIIKSKRFLSSLLTTCNDKYNMNINEDSLIKEINIIENKLNVYNINLPIFSLYGLNYMIYQDEKELCEPTWSTKIRNTRLLVNLIHEFFYLFLTSYSNDFFCGITHRIESLEGGYLFEKQLIGTIKYNFWYDDNCCQLLFDVNTWLSLTDNSIFTDDILKKLNNLSQMDTNYLRDDIPDIQYFGIEYGVNRRPTYE
ncbi:unnamed protein product [Rotaria sordida]|uniref:Uncharacterized protein n=1 Tax=Rotaria sordida TaxID=392033 RepID=A0A819C224_9BILA|nr:unnamed protein product [Rotaria sordida]CAF1391454.1 unnamed protein product [Rotaria sordida]CAF3805649.1 unnamed protein product [Rotaria sordida]CAF3926085.1 unnamed protein product [Rotaria sordida]